MLCVGMNCSAACLRWSLTQSSLRLSFVTLRFKMSDINLLIWESLTQSLAVNVSQNSFTFIRNKRSETTTAWHAVARSWQFQQISSCLSPPTASTVSVRAARRYNACTSRENVWAHYLSTEWSYHHCNIFFSWGQLISVSCTQLYWAMLYEAECLHPMLLVLTTNTVASVFSSLPRFQLPARWGLVVYCQPSLCPQHTIYPFYYGNEQFGCCSFHSGHLLSYYYTDFMHFAFGNTL